MEPLNPYKAPAESSAGVGAPAPHRSYWAPLRFLPVVYFGIFAVLLPLGPILGLVILLSILVRERPPTLTLGSSLRLFAPPVGCTLLGGFGFVIAHAWYRCRWRRAVLLTVVFFAVLGLVGLVSESSVGRWFRDPP